MPAPARKPVDCDRDRRFRTRPECEETGKVRFRDHEEAVDLLHGAVSLRHAAAQVGRTSQRQEVRAYLCGECDGWHLTSKPDR